jgi:hypothetical protein
VKDIVAYFKVPCQNLSAERLVKTMINLRRHNPEHPEEEGNKVLRNVSILTASLHGVTTQMTLKMDAESSSEKLVS